MTAAHSHTAWVPLLLQSLCSAPYSLISYHPSSNYIRELPLLIPFYKGRSGGFKRSTAYISLNWRSFCPWHFLEFTRKGPSKVFTQVKSPLPQTNCYFEMTIDCTIWPSFKVWQCAKTCILESMKWTNPVHGHTDMFDLSTDMVWLWNLTLNLALLQKDHRI
jgi:hypothetical protein